MSKPANLIDFAGVTTEQERFGVRHAPPFALRVRLIPCHTDVGFARAAVVEEDGRFADFRALFIISLATRLDAARRGRCCA